MLLFVAVLLAFGNTSSSTNDNLMSSINLYKETFEYISAILSQGIPALHVDPLDPYSSNVTLEIQQHYDPDYPDYTDLDIQVNGITFFNFADFNVTLADLDLDAMSANFALNWDYIGMLSNDLVTSAVNTDGQLLQFNCSNVYAYVLNSTFSSLKQLELVGTHLKVKQFDLDFSPDSDLVQIFPSSCTGDDEIMDYVLEVISAVAFSLAETEIPEYLKHLSLLFTAILDDIFALRNVTDGDGMRSSQQSDSLNMFLESRDGDETIKRSMKYASHQKSSSSLKKNGFTMKWTL